MSNWIIDAGRGSPVWGEGFVEDGWSDLLAVRSWDEVEPDQYVRFFPQLLAADHRVPDRVVVHLASRVAALADAPAVRTPDLMRAARALVFGSRRPARQAAIGTGEGAFLAGVLGEVRRYGHASPDPARTALFAYLTGLHPSYIWPDAIATHERDTVAGWLGVVARGRPALMPLDVADYLADTILSRAGGYILRDGQIGPLARAVCPKRLLKAAEARRQGRSPVVRRTRPGTIARAWAVEGSDRPGAGGVRPRLSGGRRLPTCSGSHPAI